MGGTLADVWPQMLTMWIQMCIRDRRCQIFLLHDRSGRVIGIAQPQHAHLFRQAIPLALRRKPIMPEIAVMGALEGLDVMLNDALYGILFRDINMQRTLVDQYLSLIHI